MCVVGGSTGEGGAWAGKHEGRGVRASRDGGPSRRCRRCTQPSSTRKAPPRPDRGAATPPRAQSPPTCLSRSCCCRARSAASSFLRSASSSNAVRSTVCCVWGERAGGRGPWCQVLKVSGMQRQPGRARAAQPAPGAAPAAAPAAWLAAHWLVSQALHSMKVAFML